MAEMVIDKKPLTKRQRQILALIRDIGPAQFYGGTRRFIWGALKDGGVYIKAYMEPEIFLERRGFIAVAPSNRPGRWYALTEAGRVRAAKLKPVKGIC
jgi:hypothetical protein